MVDEIFLIIMCLTLGYIIGHAHGKKKTWKKSTTALDNFTANKFAK